MTVLSHEFLGQLVSFLVEMTEHSDTARRATAPAC